MARGEPTKTIAHARAGGEIALTVHCLGFGCYHQAQSIAIGRLSNTQRQPLYPGVPFAGGKIGITFTFALPHC